jgi:serine/threonine-protein kinase
VLPVEAGVDRGPAPGDAPRIVGRYAIFSEIAAGGMATVHLGRLLGPVGFSRVVAIKRLHPRMSDDPEFVAMFLDESRIAARIRHPNVVVASDVVAEGGEIVLVMEYVEGESLVRLVKGQLEQTGAPPPPAIVSAVVCGVLHGLHAAHEARSERGDPLGVVHRDVSPQNVLVGVDGVARVLDFGIAKAIGRMQTTRVGQVKGKLAYMAPEQIRVDGALGPATDVYAASVVLWEALTGRRLFAGDESQVVAAIFAGDVPAPSTLAPGIPPEVDRVVLRGLAADPAARFASARDMALALERALPVASQPAVGAWVASVARDALARRAAMVAAVERASPGDLGRTATAGSAPPAGVRPGAPSRVWVVAVIAGISGAALAVGGVALVTRSRDAPIESGGVPSAASTSPAPSSPAPPTTAASEVPPAPAATASPTASAAAPSASIPPPARPRPRASTKPETPDCRVPHYFDAEGIKRYKPGCAR